MKRRILSLATAVALLVTSVPMVSFAAETEPVGFDLGTEATSYDAAALNNEYVSENVSGKRLSLNADAESGKWVVANFDDTADSIDTKMASPMQKEEYDAFNALGTKNWATVDVPSNLTLKTGYEKAHRVWFKTTIDVPASDVNNGFYLDFDGTCYVATVVVNGDVVKTNKTTRLPWEADLTGKLHAGKNEIMIGMKSPRYAIDVPGIQSRTNSDVLKKMTKLSDYFDFDWYGEDTFTVDKENLDELMYNDTIYPTTKGDGAGDQFGITDRLYLVSTQAKTYVDDVFVKTTVVDTKTWEPTNKKINAQITIANPTGDAKTVKVAAKAVLRDNNDASKDIDLKSVDVTFAKDEFTKVIDLTVDAPNAELWWPDITKQKMYDLVATITENSATIDTYKQAFGFKDVNIDGIYFRINGEKRKFWNGLDGLKGANEEEMIKNFKKGNNRFERMGCDLISSRLVDTREALGYVPNMDQQLDWLDKNGIPVRLSTMIDGMFANFAPVVDGKDNMVMWENFKQHLEGVALAHRNHPSIVMYSLENEFVFINVALLYGGYADRIEKLCKTYMFDPVEKLDGTKPSSLDGGGNGLDNSQPIYNSHYQEDTDITVNSKPMTELSAMHGRWEYDGKVPYCGGEIAFYSGENKEHSWLGGDNTADGKAQALAAYAKYVRWTYRRFRYNDVAMTSPWVAADSTQIAYPSINDIAVIAEDYATNFYASKGKTIKAKIFNDTFSYHKAPKPITYTWKLVIDGKAVQEGTGTETIKAGESVPTTIDIKPIDGITERKDATLELRATMEGTKSFEEDIEMAVFPNSSKLSINRKVYGYKLNSAEKAAIKDLGVTIKSTPTKEKAKTTKYYAKKKAKSKKWKVVSKKVYKKTKAKLRKKKLVNKYKITYKIKKGKKWKKVAKKAYDKVKSKKKKKKIKKAVTKAFKLTASNYKQYLKSTTGILVIGSKTIKSETPGEAEFAAIARFARGGGRVVMLEQNEMNMLTSDTTTSSNELPEELKIPGSTAQGQYNFAQAFDTPMLEGLKLHDLSFWSGVKRTTSPLWAKPGGSVKSWIYAGSPNDTKKALEFSSLIEVPSIKGVVLASQMNIGQSISVEPAAKILFRNMLRRADTFELPKGTLAVLDNAPAELKNVVKATKVQNKEIATSAITTVLDDPAQYPMLIVEATADNLTLLNTNKAKCESYASKGGWIMLWGLNPDADKVDQYGYPADGKDINASTTLAKFNELLGTKHVMRPFRVEATKAGGDYYDRISMGLSTQNVFLKNKAVIAPWINLCDASKQTFTYAVDATDNIAPFHPFELEGGENGVRGAQFKAVKDVASKKRDLSQVPNDVGRDRNNGNMVDDLYNDDFWFYLRQIWLGYDKDSAEEYMKNNPIAQWTFPSTEEIDKVVIFNNDNYGWYTKIKVTPSLDGNVLADNAVEVSTPKNADTAFDMKNVKANSLKVEGTALEVGKMAGGANVMAGVDEIKVLRKTPQWAIDAGVKSLTSNGTLVKYARGDKNTGGGYLLNNVKLSKYYDYLDNPDAVTLGSGADAIETVGVKSSMEPSTNTTAKNQIFSIFFQNAGCSFN